MVVTPTPTPSGPQPLAGHAQNYPASDSLVDYHGSVGASDWGPWDSHKVPNSSPSP